MVGIFWSTTCRYEANVNADSSINANGLFCCTSFWTAVKLPCGDEVSSASTTLILRPNTPPLSFSAWMRALKAAAPLLLAEATPVSDVTMPTVIVSVVMPGALAVFPLVFLLLPPDDDDFLLLLPHAAATIASAATAMATPRKPVRDKSSPSE